MAEDLLGERKPVFACALVALCLVSRADGGGSPSPTASQQVAGELLERPSVSVICPAVGSARGGEIVTVTGARRRASQPGFSFAMRPDPPELANRAEPGATCGAHRGSKCSRAAILGE